MADTAGTDREIVRDELEQCLGPTRAARIESHVAAGERDIVITLHNPDGQMADEMQASQSILLAGPMADSVVFRPAVRRVVRHLLIQMKLLSHEEAQARDD
jgi:hypothetical protein